VKLTATRAALMSALVPAVAVTSSRSAHPFGACVLFAAEDGGITIRSSSMVASVRSTCLASVEKKGSVALPAEELLDRVKKIGEGPISISIAKDKFTIKAGSQVYTLRTLSPDSFPAHPVAHDQYQPVNPKALASVLASTTYSCGDESMKVEFQGVVLTAVDGLLTATGSNRQRFARAWAKSDGLTLSTFLPAKAIEVLLSAPSDEVDVAATDRAVSFRLKADTATIELAYSVPEIGALPYDAMFARFSSDVGPNVSRKELLAALRAVTPDGTAGSVPVVLRCSKGTLHLSHVSVDGDESTDEVEVDAAHDWTVVAEARYLLDAVGKATGDEVRLCVGGDVQPLVLRGTDWTSMIAPIDPAQCKRPVAVKEAA